MKRRLFFALLFIMLLTTFVWCYTRYQDDPDGIYLGAVNGVGIFGDRNAYPNENVSDDFDFQCIELVRRYYFQKFGIILPNVSTNHAKDIIYEYPSESRLVQCLNSKTTNIPKVGDILVFDATVNNPHGHVAIVSEVDKASKTIMFAQQNWPTGPFGEISYNLINHKVVMENYGGYKVLGFLTLGSSNPAPIPAHDFQITNSYPKNGAKNVEIRERVIIKFNTNIQDQVTNENISDYIKIQIIWSNGKSFIMKNPKIYLRDRDKIIIDETWPRSFPKKGRTKVKIIIKNNLKNIDGNKLNKDYGITFTTIY